MLKFLHMGQTKFKFWLELGNGSRVETFRKLRLLWKAVLAEVELRAHHTFDHRCKELRWDVFSSNLVGFSCTRLIYERVPYQKTVFTLAASCIWHGIYPGYLLTVTSAGMLIVVSKKVSFIPNSCSNVIKILCPDQRLSSPYSVNTQVTE